MTIHWNGKLFSTHPYVLFKNTCDLYIYQYCYSLHGLCFECWGIPSCSSFSNSPSHRNTVSPLFIYVQHVTVRCMFWDAAHLEMFVGVILKFVHKTRVHCPYTADAVNANLSEHTWTIWTGNLSQNRLPCIWCMLSVPRRAEVQITNC